MRGVRPGEDGFTGLELVIILVFLIGAGVILLLFFPGGGTGAPLQTFPGGFVADSMYVTGDHLQTVGNVYGFPQVSTNSGKLPLLFRQQDPGQLGAVRFTTSLFIGSTGAIDMDCLAVQWTGASTPEVIPRTFSGPLACPGWFISGKYNMLPGRTADADDLLEPGEQFEITACPLQGVRPYGIISLRLQPEGTAMPLTINRMAPGRIQPVMKLG
jgi:hypothetical protein